MKHALPLSLCLALGLAAPAAAQDMIGSPVRGADIAAAVCAECHAVAPGERGVSRIGAPAFQDVADEPSATEMGLRLFLRSPHVTMPDIRLTDDEIDHLVAYIRSLE